MTNLTDYILYLIGCSIPIVLTVLFVLSIVMYCSAKRKNKKSPGAYTDGQIRGRLIFLIISSAVFGTFLLFAIGVIILLTCAIAFM